MNRDVAAEIDALFPQMPDNRRRELLIAGLRSFQVVGFHGTSTRAVAKAAGLSPAAVYVHFESKVALLYEIALAGHRGSLDAVRAALDADRASSRHRVLTFVETFTTWHASHAAVARVIQYEMSALPDDKRSRVVRVRRATEGLLRAEMLAGIKDGSISVDDPDTTRRALLSLGVDVARWYRRSGRIAPDDLGRQYAALADGLLGRPAARRNAS
jgi:AcrR family transcriptional regulator